MKNIDINEQERYKLLYLVGSDLERKKDLISSTSNELLQKILTEEIEKLQLLYEKIKGGDIY